MDHSAVDSGNMRCNGVPVPPGGVQPLHRYKPCKDGALLTLDPLQNPLQAVTRLVTKWQGSDVGFSCATVNEGVPEWARLLLFVLNAWYRMAWRSPTVV